MTLALDRIATVAEHAIIGHGTGHGGEAVDDIGRVAFGDLAEVLGAIKVGGIGKTYRRHVILPLHFC